MVRLPPKPHIFLTAGGTGGHIFPALALAELLLSKGYVPHLITDPRGMRLHKSVASLVVHRMTLSGMGQGNALRKAWGFFGLGLGFLQSLFWIWKFCPRAVIGFGGYPTLPPMCAAILLKRQTLIHEQNAVLGRVNRCLAPGVKKIAVSFPRTRNLPQKPPGAIQFTGMPVREAIRAVRKMPYPSLENPPLLRLLVLGGSQGAKIFSEILPAAVSRLPHALQQRLHIVQQCRREDLKDIKEAYDRLKISTELSCFFEDIAGQLTAAHLVIARAGASTCAEVMISGRPALFVPFPWAMDDHQTENARWIAGTDAAWHCAQKNLTPDSLAAMLAAFMTNPTPLIYASEAMHALGGDDAAQKLAEFIIS